METQGTKPNIKIDVKTVPHPNPNAAFDLIAKLIVKQLVEQQPIEMASNH